jgi:hypothetical protein
MLFVSKPIVFKTKVSILFLQHQHSCIFLFISKPAFKDNTETPLTPTPVCRVVLGVTGTVTSTQDSAPVNLGGSQESVTQVSVHTFETNINFIKTYCVNVE